MNNTYVNKAECVSAGLDAQEVALIAKGLARYGKRAAALGICIFGGSGTGSLRYMDDRLKGSLVLGYFDGFVDGGDGIAREDEKGFLRGEGVQS